MASVIEDLDSHFKRAFEDSLRKIADAHLKPLEEMLTRQEIEVLVVWRS